MALSQRLFEVFALGFVGVLAGVEDVGDRAPARPTRQGLLLGGGGGPSVALHPRQGVDDGDVGQQPGLGARRDADLGAGLEVDRRWVGHLLRWVHSCLGRDRVLGSVVCGLTGGGIGDRAEVGPVLGWRGRGSGGGVHLLHLHRSRLRRHQRERGSLRGVEDQRVDRRRRAVLALFLGGIAIGAAHRGQRRAARVDDPGIGGQVEAVLGEQRQLWVVGLAALTGLLLARYSIGYPSARRSSSTSGVSRGTRW